MPRHVAIILDGNGRWAKARGLPRNMGHVEGAKTVEVICEEAYRMGIQYLTVYAFSTENWSNFINSAKTTCLSHLFVELWTLSKICLIIKIFYFKNL